jgi:hypothetical protein
MKVLKTMAIDIKHSVFDNETEAIMYVTKDIYSNSFIISIPVITFSWRIWEDRIEKDYEDLLKFDLMGNKDWRQRLVEEIRKAIKKFEG